MANQTSFIAPGGGRVTGFEDDPIYSRDTVDPRTFRGDTAHRVGVPRPDGLSIAALFGTPLPGGYTASLRNASMRAPEAAAANPTGFQSGYVKSNNARLPQGDLPAVAAIEAAAPRRSNLFADAGYAAKPRFATASTAGGIGADPGDTGLFGVPISPGMAEIIATDPRYRAPAGATPTKWAASKPAPAPAPAKPAGLLETIASMFTPSAAPAAPSYTTTPFQESNFQTTSGAQMPSATNNSRWTTGY